MKMMLRTFLLLILTINSFAALAQDRCKDCDCTSYPVKPACEKCCGVATGVIKEFAQSRLTVAVKDSRDETFRVTEETKIEGKPENGARVRVVYKIKDKVAGLIQINPNS